MKISVLTLFPEMFTPLFQSITGRAMEAEKFTLQVLNIRDFSKDKHKKCDDYPFGGGAGMLMTPQPVFDALTFADPDRTAKRVYLSPKGRTFCQDTAKEYSGLDHIVLLCGHYEGLDQRIIDNYIDEELSVGDYILTGGELPAMLVCDCVARLLSGVLADGAHDVESFTDGLLEYPQYTRPAVFEGHEVPPVLLSGNHGEVDKYRQKMQQQLTSSMRPDLIERKKGKEFEK